MAFRNAWKSVGVCRALPAITAGTALLAGVSAAGAASDESPVAVWDTAGRLLVGGGYRDNVLLSSFQPEHSPFVEVAGDFSVIRLSETDAMLSFFVLGEFRRYLEDIEVDGQRYELEQLVSVTVDWSKPVDERNTLGAGFDYFYQYEVMDVSETEVDENRMLVKGHSFSIEPDWKHQLNPDWAFSLLGTADRQLYEVDLDDFWQGSVRARLARSYGHRSEASVFYKLRHRFYDTREQYTVAGVPEPGTSLVYRSHEVAGEVRHHWDKDRHWRTAIKAGWLLSEDNGSGYFDYERIQFSAGVRWKHAGWDIGAVGRAGWYLYDLQQVAGENRERSYYIVDGRVERWLTAHWLAYLAASREWNLSNDPLEEYNDWVASAGIGAEF